jgi:hypothetical protein
MVRIISYKPSKTSEGKEFFSLELQSDLELVKSLQTGRFYATAHTVLVPTTFDEQTCKSLMGRSLPGKIDKVPSKPYEYTIKETGEVITLSYRWEYTNEALQAEVTGDSNIAENGELQHLLKPAA